MKQELLSEIGLTGWESQTYLALLELGLTTTGPLVEKSDVPHSKIYAVLKSLIKKGLVSYIIKGKTKYFQVSSPQKIFNLFKEKEIRIKRVIEELKFKQKQEKHSVELFEGMKAIRGMFLDIINKVKKGESWYGFSTGKTSENTEIEEFYEWWGAHKNLRKLKDHLLISLKNKETFLRSISKEAIPFARKITKYSKISFPGDVAIFRNQVVILNWDETPTATLITNKNLAEQYTAFFLDLWKIAKK